MVLLAWDGPSREARVPTGPTAPQLERLDRAVALVNAARPPALKVPEVVTEGATALDGADEACATGQTALARQARARAGSAVPPVGRALSALPQQLSAYRVALAALTPAAGPLEGDQQEALTAVRTAGEAEAGALEAFGAAAEELWPAYAALDQAQSLWLERRSAGWYRSQREAADAYVLLRRPGLAALERARAALAKADADRRPSTDRMRGALTAADAALEALRAPVG